MGGLIHLRSEVMDSRGHPWAWPWWLLALVLLTAGVFVCRQVIEWRQQQPAVQPVEFSLSESCGVMGIALGEYQEGGHPVSNPDPADRKFPESWELKDLEAAVEVEIPPGTAASIYFSEFNQVQQLLPGDWAMLPVRQPYRQAFSFHANLQAGKHLFRGVFRILSKAHVVENPLVTVFHSPSSKAARTATCRISVKPVE
jgi:hypothetical protein